jgi:diaminohydroxyphosphoribosylaminopyrimidine deaminase/5-amino-6-(5-phosphoribosylamino)uracil reductase
MVAVGSASPESDRERLRNAGCEILICQGETHTARLVSLLDELGRRRMTNVLVEGGGRLLGSLLDLRQIDEVHVFIAPKLVGGAAAKVPIAGEGIAEMADALPLESPALRQLGADVYLRARVQRSATG